MATVISTRRPWAGRVLTGLAALFLLFDSIIKFFHIAPVIDSFAQLGFPLALAPVIGSLELVCLAVYLVPRLAIPGAILLTGFLGGAIVVHLRVGDPLFSHILFPAYIGALVWGGLYLRDHRLKSLLVDFPEPRSTH